MVLQEIANSLPEALLHGHAPRRPMLPVEPQDATEARKWRAVILSDILDIDNQMDDPTRRERAESAEAYLRWLQSAQRARRVKMRQVIELEAAIEHFIAQARDFSIAAGADARSLLEAAHAFFTRIGQDGWDLDADEQALVAEIRAYLLPEPSDLTHVPHLAAS